MSDDFFYSSNRTEGRQLKRQRDESTGRASPRVTSHFLVRCRLKRGTTAAW